MRAPIGESGYRSRRLPHAKRALYHSPIQYITRPASYLSGIEGIRPPYLVSIFQYYHGRSILLSKYERRNMIKIILQSAERGADNEVVSTIKRTHKQRT